MGSPLLSEVAPMLLKGCCVLANSYWYCSLNRNGLVYDISKAKKASKIVSKSSYGFVERRYIVGV